MKKISDKERLDWLERSPIIGFVIFGRLARGADPVGHCKTARQAIDTAIRAEAKGKK